MSNKDIKILIKLINYIKPYKWLLILVIILSLISTGIHLYLPYIFKIAVDECILKNNLEKFKKLASQYLYLLFLAAIFSAGIQYFIRWIGQSAIRDIRMDVFSHIQKLKKAFFDKEPIGKIVTTVTNDEETLDTLFAQMIITIFSDICIIIGAFIAMFFLNTLLTSIVISGSVIIGIATHIFRIKAKKIYSVIREWVGKLNTKLNETFIGMNIIKIFAQEEMNYKKFTQINENYYISNMRQTVIQGIFLPTTNMIITIIIAIIIWKAGGDAIKGLVSIGTIVAFIRYIRMIEGPISNMANRFDIIQEAITACDKIYSIIDNKEKESEEGIEINHNGKIEFKNVYFSYNNTKNWILKDISFSINEGEKVAIVGYTGAGKTTIINLINKFYVPQKGEIFIDGVPINKINIKSLRKNIATISQEDFIFSGSITENIDLKNGNEEKAKKLSKTINADKVIEKRPQKYDTNVGEKGSLLSQGERQLISLMRAINNEPKILILDEATREIDNEMERLIQQGIYKIAKDKTTIIIAHKLSTIQNVDKIIVIHKGKVIGEGKHAEIIKNNPVYQAIYRLHH